MRHCKSNSRVDGLASSEDATETRWPGNRSLAPGITYILNSAALCRDSHPQW